LLPAAEGHRPLRAEPRTVTAYVASLVGDDARPVVADATLSRRMEAIGSSTGSTRPTRRYPVRWPPGYLPRARSSDVACHPRCHARSVAVPDQLRLALNGEVDSERL
jgi:hypothetical protein